jgi:hypothetical protein
MVSIETTCRANPTALKEQLSEILEVSLLALGGAQNYKITPVRRMSATTVTVHETATNTPHTSLSLARFSRYSGIGLAAATGGCKGSTLGPGDQRPQRRSNVQSGLGAGERAAVVSTIGGSVSFGLRLTSRFGVSLSSDEVALFIACLCSSAIEDQ